MWASRSQCRQRQGRTGRTGRGTVYRLVLRNHYLQLAPFETPAMLLRPLRREALALMSAAEKALRDVQVGLLEGGRVCACVLGGGGKTWDGGALPQSIRYTAGRELVSEGTRCLWSAPAAV